MSELNSADFGVDLSILDKSGFGSLPGYIDCIEVKIYYTAAAGDIDEVDGTTWANVDEINTISKANIDELDGISST